MGKKTRAQMLYIHIWLALVESCHIWEKIENMVEPTPLVRLDLTTGLLFYLDVEINQKIKFGETS